MHEITKLGAIYCSKLNLSKHMRVRWTYGYKPNSQALDFLHDLKR